jgi:CheY-like chemotaxis protein
MSIPKKVCIVDDDMMVQFTIKKMIQAIIAPENIMSFTDGEAIYEYLLKNADKAEALPDVMFLDLNMPYMDGWEFLNNYAALKPKLAKDFTIYVLSSSVADMDVQAAKANEYVKDYIHKPISRARIEEILN